MPQIKDTEDNYECVKHEYQVDKPNGDIDFVTVYDLPEQVATKWCKQKYPDCKISRYQTTSR